VAAHGHRDSRHRVRGRQQEHAAPLSQPEIIADAAHWILTQPSRELTGQFLIDDEVLARAGVTDFTAYAVDPSAPLALDFFLDDKGPHVREVVRLGATPTH
jgi:hypothetical protein